MLVEATVTLDDPESGTPLSVLVEADVQETYPSASSEHSFGQLRAVGMEWLELTGGRPVTRKDEGTPALRGLAQDLVDADVNWWRVREALVAAYAAKTGAKEVFP